MFIFLRIAMAIQRFNTVALAGTLSSVALLDLYARVIITVNEHRHFTQYENNLQWSRAF